MPILDVSVVVNTGEFLPEGIAKQLADAAGVIFKASSGTTWVRLHTLEKNDYAENGVLPTETPLPVFVEILQYQHSSASEAGYESMSLAREFAAILSRQPENVHLLYLPEGKGRVAFGGRPEDRH